MAAAMTAEGGRSIEVESGLGSDGDLQVALTLDRPSRWFKPKPIYLTQWEARRLGHELLKAAGNDYVTVLDEELAQLKEAINSTTSVEDHDRLVMLRDMVKVMKRMVAEPVDG
jgi:hypothetical protein